MARLGLGLAKVCLTFPVTLNLFQGPFLPIDRRLNGAMDPETSSG